MSWFRVIATLVGVGLMIGSILLYLDWKRAFLLEISKPDPDYQGLVDLFQVMMIGFVSGLFAMFVTKVVQKKYENIGERNSTDQEP